MGHQLDPQQKAPMTENEFHDLAQRFRDFFKELRASMPEVHAFVTRPRWVEMPNGGHSAYDVIPDVKGTFRAHAEAVIEQSSAPPPVVADIARSETFRRYANVRWQRSDGSDSTDFACRMFVRGILVSICNDDGAIDEERWLRLLPELRDLLVHGKVPYRLVMPLYGLLVTSSVDLGGITLRPTDDEDRSRFAVREGDGPRRLTCAAALEFCDSRQPGPRTSSGPESQQLNDAYRALNVWCPWSVFPAHMAFIGLRMEATTALVNTDEPRLPPPAQPLVEPDGFRKFWLQCRDVFARPPGGLDVALSRHQLMKDQPRASDRVLDQAIILEALFLKGGEKQELSYRLALRAAHFVGETLAERQEVNATVKAAYNLRSKIAHGDKPDARDNKVQAALDGVVRAALIKFCLEAAQNRDGKLQERICDRMDSYVLERAGDKS